MNIQNTNASNGASITIQWFDAATGNEVLPATNDTIPANGRKTYTAPGTTFKGSAVVSSGETVVAEVQVIGNSTGISAGYTGGEAGDTTLYIPQILRSAWETLVAVQNVGTANTNVTLTVRDTGGTTVASKTINNVKPNASAYFDIKNDPEFSGITKFFESALVTSSGGVPILHPVVDQKYRSVEWQCDRE